MDRSLGTPAQPRIQDVTDQILKTHKIYGSSDFTAQFATSSSRALNYANGASIQKPEVERVTTIPRIINYQDAVGLFGAENHFIRVDLKVQNPVSACYEEPNWECARISEEEPDPQDPYTAINSGGSTPGQAYIDPELDLTIVNDYEPANILGNTAYGLNNSLIRVDLTNLKTGNIYIDNWLDIRLYNKAREEHPYNTMYVGPRDFFYIGFHARNTRRLPYNVECVIGGALETNEGLVNKNQVPRELKAIS